MSLYSRNYEVRVLVTLSPGHGLAVDDLVAGVLWFTHNFMVRSEGFEPPRLRHPVLSRTRLPFRHGRTMLHTPEHNGLGTWI